MNNKQIRKLGNLGTLYLLSQGKSKEAMFLSLANMTLKPKATPAQTLAKSKASNDLSEPFFLTACFSVILFAQEQQTQIIFFSFLLFYFFIQLIIHSHFYLCSNTITFSGQTPTTETKENLQIIKFSKVTFVLDNNQQTIKQK
jgi:hypothetical protein